MRQQAAFFHSPRMFFCLFIRKVIFSQYNIRRAALSDVLYRLTETNLFHAHSLGPDKQAGKEKPAAGIFFCGGKRKVRARRVRFLSFLNAHPEPPIVALPFLFFNYTNFLREPMTSPPPEPFRLCVLSELDAAG
jgi:hypothetical protein